MALFCVGFIEHPLSQDCHNTRHSMVLLSATFSLEKRKFPTNEAMFYVFMPSLRVLGTQHIFVNPLSPCQDTLSTTAELRLDASPVSETDFPTLQTLQHSSRQHPTRPTTLEHESWSQTLPRGWTWSSHYCRPLLKSPSNKVGWFHRFRT